MAFCGEPGWLNVARRRRRKPLLGLPRELVDDASHQRCGEIFLKNVAF